MGKSSQINPKSFTWISIVGARPQFIKLAPLVYAIEHYNTHASHISIQHKIIHTGQHYDKGLSDVFFEELAIPAPDAHLAIGSGKHGAQTGQMLEAIEDVLLIEKPDWVIVFGDTNSTLAAALAAAKLQIPIAHIEAGLRSFNRAMPEEINRILTDHASDLLFAPTHMAMIQLHKEGLGEKARQIGDLMYDAVLQNQTLAQKKSTILDDLNLISGEFALLTLHRAENTNSPQRLMNWLHALNQIAARQVKLVFPMHPRTRNCLEQYKLDWQPHPNMRIIPPVSYLDMIQLLHHGRLAITDSGGLQKEAFFLNCPCITLRTETEWVETVQSKANVLVGSDMNLLTKAVATTLKQNQKIDFSQAVQTHYGDGQAAEKVILELIQNSSK